MAMRFLVPFFTSDVYVTGDILNPGGQKILLRIETQ